MTQTTASPGDDQTAGTAGRMAAIAAGLDARVHQTRGVLDVTATLYRSGSKDIEIICGEDHYVQVGYWNTPGATPAEVAAMISRALAAITAPP